MTVEPSSDDSTPGADLGPPDAASGAATESDPPPLGRDDLRAAVRYPVLAVVMTAVAFVAVKTGRDAVFFEGGGLRQLPLVYLLMAAASVPAAMLHLAALQRYGARRVRTGVFVLAAGLFTAFVPAISPSRPTAMLVLFSLVPAVFAAVFAGGWLLAGDLLNGTGGETQRRAYSRIGAGALLGGMAGGLLARGLAELLHPRWIVLAGALALLVAAATVSRAHRRHPVHPSGEDGGDPGGGGVSRQLRPARLLKLLGHAYVRRLAAISGLAAIAGLYIDFQFYAMATLTGHTGAQFFAGFYLALNAAALVLQLAVAPWIQARFGVGGALLVLPLALGGGLMGTVTLSATLLSRSVLRVAEGGIKSSIHRSSWEQAFLPLGEAARDMAKVLVDGLSGRMAEGLAAATLFLWLSWNPQLHQGTNLAWISWATLAAVVGWAILTRGLGACPAGSEEALDPRVRLPDS